MPPRRATTSQHSQAADSSASQPVADQSTPLSMDSDDNLIIDPKEAAPPGELTGMMAQFMQAQQQQPAQLMQTHQA